MYMYRLHTCMYSRGHKKVNVSYSFYYRSLIRSVFTIAIVLNND